MSIQLKVEGFKDIEKALAQIPAGTAKGVARRAMKKELKPIAEFANALWPGADDDTFIITSRIRAGQRGDSLEKKGHSVTNMFVGAAGGPLGTPHAHLLEFGTGPRYHKSGKYVGSVSPSPMLQPAWDALKGGLIQGLGARLWDEIEKTMARRAKRAAK